MDQSTLLGMPYLQPSQAQKHVTHNEALKLLDAIVQMGVLDRDLNFPPAQPTNGDRYIVSTAPSGAWSGKPNQIAHFEDNVWAFYPPNTGWLVWVQDQQDLYVWDGSDWVKATGINPSPLVGVNATPDATNRLAVKSDAVLFSHDDVTPGSGNSRLVLNKKLNYQLCFNGLSDRILGPCRAWHHRG